MNILVEPSDYPLMNRGDVASLRVALGRMRRMWPEATIRVFTEDPKSLVSIAPSVVPLPVHGHHAWNEHTIATQFLPRRPAALLSRSRGIDAYIRMRWPGGVERLMRHRHVARAPATTEIDAYLSFISAADLVVVTGMGGVTDCFVAYALGVLGTLGLAARRRVPTAMLSQQFGPLTSRGLRACARQVLPKVDLIALRENVAGEPLLRGLGVDMRRVVTTGDDTIELAYGARSGVLGDGIGVNLRCSGYAHVDKNAIEQVGLVMRSFADALHVRLIGLPISHYDEDDDGGTIAALIGSNTGGGYPAVTDLDGFLSLVRQCRVVVTGSYHCAVFALGQGIPSVCLTNAAYYDQKFWGLRALFGDGCRVVSLRTPGFATHVEGAIGRAWLGAADERAELLAAAERQVQQGQKAYARLLALAN